MALGQRSAVPADGWYVHAVDRSTVSRTPCPGPARIASFFAALLEAYRPCQYLGTCREAIWNPKRGHIPRGFLGATAKLSDVEVVMVFAEFSHPHGNETYDPGHSPGRRSANRFRDRRSQSGAFGRNANGSEPGFPVFTPVTASRFI